MSHGSANYALENARRMERERQAAIDRSRFIMSRLTQIEARLSAYSEQTDTTIQLQKLQTTLPLESATRESCEGWNLGAQRMLESMESSLKKAKAMEWSTELSSQLEKLVKSGERATTFKKSELHDTSGYDKSYSISREKRIQNLNNEIVQAISRLDSDATKLERQMIGRAATAVIEADVLDAETLLTNLKVLVQSIGKKARKRREDSKRALELIQKLDGVVGPKDDPEVSDLRQLLQRVVDGETSLLKADEKIVSEVRNRAIAAEDREYVSHQVAEVFSKLGYEVHESFRKKLVSGKAAYILDGESSDYAAELQVNNGKLSFRLVHASHSTNSINDVKMEAKLCRTVGVLSARIKEQGGELQSNEYFPAGSELLTYSKEAADLRASRQQDTHQLKERQR